MDTWGPTPMKIQHKMKALMLKTMSIKVHISNPGYVSIRPQQHFCGWLTWYKWHITTKIHAFWYVSKIDFFGLETIRIDNYLTKKNSPSIWRTFFESLDFHIKLAGSPSHWCIFQVWYWWQTPIINVCNALIRLLAVFVSDSAFVDVVPDKCKDRRDWLFYKTGT